MDLTALDRALLDGTHGAAARFAMDLLARYGAAVGATRFIDIAQAHVDGCLHHGAVSLDYVAHLTSLGGRVRVPTTLNVGSIDLIHPELFRGDTAIGTDGRRVMELHLELGCLPTFTCAPYQTIHRPRRGEQIAWGESNAIVFANSVIGAWTERYGDFIDLAAALTGRVPEVGLHLARNRVGQVLFVLTKDVADWPRETLAIAVGAVLGLRAGSAVPVIDGLPSDLTEDDLKALGAVAASTGGVALFHAVGLTPEAPDRAAALGGLVPAETHLLDAADLAQAIDRLSTVPAGTALGAVALGTPHFSAAEFDRLLAMLDGFSGAPGVDLYINTGRATHDALSRSGDLDRLTRAGFTIVVDTCTYVTAVMREIRGAVMTNSGKWAHYAPGNLGIDVAFGSLADCLASAAAGRVTRAPR